jgi:2-oxoglutarate ferredoxin oxidoreductase subunit beta
MGSIERPVEPLALALSAEASFVARTMDTNVQHLGDVLAQAAAHKGTSFIEVYQNCIIFNPHEWDQYGDRKTRADHMVFLEDGQPMVFGVNSDKGIIMGKDLQPKVVELGDEYSESDLLVHDAHAPNCYQAYMLTRLRQPAVMGVFRSVERQTYNEGLSAQVAEAQAKNGVGDLNKLYRQSELWTVE